jgi:hypothetical protein
MPADHHHIQYVPESPNVGMAFVGWSAFGALLLLSAAIGGLYEIYHHVEPPRTLPAPQEFPQPRVDTQEREDLQRINNAQLERLRTWKWSDSQHSEVQIPIERAMQLLANKGAGAYEPLLPAQAALSPPTAAAERATIQKEATPAARVGESPVNPESHQ